MGVAYMLGAPSARSSSIAHSLRQLLTASHTRTIPSCCLCLSAARRRRLPPFLVIFFYDVRGSSFWDEIRNTAICFPITIACPDRKQGEARPFTLPQSHCREMRGAHQNMLASPRHIATQRGASLSYVKTYYARAGIQGAEPRPHSF